MSEHQETLAALRQIADVLARIEHALTHQPRQVETIAGRRVLSLTETAKAIRRGYAATRELVESGQIPGVLDNGRWRVPVQSVQAWLDEQAHAA